MAISTFGGTSSAVSAPRWTIPGNAFSATSSGSPQADSAFVSTLSVTAGAYIRWHIEAIVTASAVTPFVPYYTLSGAAVASGFSSFGTFSGDTIDTSYSQPYPIGVNNAGIGSFPATSISGTPPTLAAGLSGLLILDMDFAITTGGTFTIAPGWNTSSGITYSVKRRASLQIL